MIDQYFKVFIKNGTKMAFLLKRRDGRDIAKKRYCPVQNGTYGQPNHRGAKFQVLTVA
jgi:hypothetical protein